MAQKHTNELEMQVILNEMVKCGHAEMDSDGRYRLTQLGERVLRKQKFNDCLAELGHESAITYAGLVHVTQFPLNLLNESIIEAVDEGILEFGCIDDNPSTHHIFYLSCRKVGSNLKLLCHPSEKNGNHPHADGERALWNQLENSSEL